MDGQGDSYIPPQTLFAGGIIKKSPLGKKKSGLYKIGDFLKEVKFI